jgi:hypothetical protein
VLSAIPACDSVDVLIPSHFQGGFSQSPDQNVCSQQWNFYGGTDGGKKFQHHIKINKINQLR